MVPGERAVSELILAAPARIRELSLESGRDMPELERLAAQAGVAVQRRTRASLESLAGPGLARGVVAVADSPLLHDVADLLDASEGRSLPSGRRVLVALDGVQDPQNLGAIIRSAEFFGAGGVFWAKDRAAPLSPSAVRASAGASERLPIAEVTNLARALETCRSQDYWLAGTVVDGGQPLSGADLPDQLVVVLGSEQKGIRRLTRETCDFLVTVGGAGGVGSLNVASAGAVALALLA